MHKLMSRKVEESEVVAIKNIKPPNGHQTALEDATHKDESGHGRKSNVSNQRLGALRSNDHPRDPNNISIELLKNESTPVRGVPGPKARNKPEQQQPQINWEASESVKLSDSDNENFTDRKSRCGKSPKGVGTVGDRLSAKLPKVISTKSSKSNNVLVSTGGARMFIHL